MSLDTYANLKAEISDWANRTDLPEDTLLDLVEADLNRKLRVSEMVATTTLTIDAQSISLPSDFLGQKAVVLQTNPKVQLSYVDNGQVDALYPAGSGQPSVFTIIGTGTIKFGPAPDSTYTASMIYYQKIPALSSSQTTNWLLTNHPDAYLFGARAMAALYLDPSAENTETQNFVSLYNNSLASIDENSKLIDFSTPTQVFVSGGVA